MSKAHLPPVPPANRSSHGDSEPGKGKLPEREAERTIESKNRHLEQQGRQGNIKQNTTNQGYQQDR
ncbi:MAG: hypothetical protein K2X74_21440 [Acetobacteraceae bacterium]|nr:hypothetical protein [Acetobacteraceae bacterium]